MRALTFGRVAGSFFILIALAHVYRLVSFFPVQIGSLSLPQQASWLGVLVAGGMGIWGFRSRG